MARAGHASRATKMAAAGEATAPPRRDRPRRSRRGTGGAMSIATLTGEVLGPDDPGYADVRPPFNVMHPDRPNLVVRCREAADVVAAVRYARDHGLHPVVRG